MQFCCVAGICFSSCAKILKAAIVFQTKFYILAARVNLLTYGILKCLTCVFQMCGVMLSGSEESTPSIIYHCVLRGLERLLLSEQLSRLDSESLVKLSVDRVNVHSPHRAMAALGLMLTCMYTGVDLFISLLYFLIFASSSGVLVRNSYTFHFKFLSTL